MDGAEIATYLRIFMKSKLFSPNTRWIMTELLIADILCLIPIWQSGTFDEYTLLQGTVWAIIFLVPAELIRFFLVERHFEKEAIKRRKIAETEVDPPKKYQFEEIKKEVEIIEPISLTTDDQICIDAANDDEDIMKEACNRLNEININCNVLEKNKKINDLKEIASKYHAVIVICENAPSEWVEHRLCLWERESTGERKKAKVFLYRKRKSLDPKLKIPNHVKERTWDTLESFSLDVSRTLKYG